MSATPHAEGASAVPINTIEFAYYNIARRYDRPKVKVPARPMLTNAPIVLRAAGSL